MSEEKKEQKIDLKDKMLSDDDLGQVSGGKLNKIPKPVKNDLDDVYGKRGFFKK